MVVHHFDAMPLELLHGESVHSCEVFVTFFNVFLLADVAMAPRVFMTQGASMQFTRKHGPEMLVTELNDLKVTISTTLMR